MKAWAQDASINLKPVLDGMAQDFFKHITDAIAKKADSKRGQIMHRVKRAVAAKKQVTTTETLNVIPSKAGLQHLKSKSAFAAPVGKVVPVPIIPPQNLLRGPPAIVLTKTDIAMGNAGC